MAQGVPLHQTSIPSTSSFSNMSSDAQDIAPGTPHRSPTHPPSPTYQASHAHSSDAMHETQHAGQQAASWDATSNSTVNQAQSIDEWSAVQLPAQNLQSSGSTGPSYAQTDDLVSSQVVAPKVQTLRQNAKLAGIKEKLPGSPLLATSRGSLLSEKVADAGQLLSQDTMLRSHSQEESQANTAGLSEKAVQTGFRAAGKVNMTEGMSDPVTETLEALKLAGNSPGAETTTDTKGRLVQVSQFIYGGCLMSFQQL